MVFEKFEAWNFASPGATDLHSSAWQFWGQRGYQLRPTGPGAFQGRSFQSKLGIHRVVDVTVLPSASGAVVQLRFRADVREDVAVGGAVVAVLLLPVAVVGAAISWHEYETDWSQERWAFWNHLVGTAQARPAASAPVPPVPAPIGGSAPAAGPSASGPLPSSPSALPGPGGGPLSCPACGAPVTGAGRYCASCGAAIPPH